MHPLTKLLFEEGHFSGHRKPIEAEKVITTYLKGRAEWLKTEIRVCDVRRGHFSLLDSLILTAFELDEKCEEIKLKCKGCEYEEDVVSNVGHPCWDCKPYGSANGFKLKAPRSSLPSKINEVARSFTAGEFTAIIHFIDACGGWEKVKNVFLHSKEAREG